MLVLMPRMCSFCRAASEWPHAGPHSKAVNNLTGGQKLGDWTLDVLSLEIFPFAVVLSLRFVGSDVQEDRALVVLRQELGPQWTCIAMALPGRLTTLSRTASAC